MFIIEGIITQLILPWCMELLHWKDMIRSESRYVIAGALLVLLGVFNPVFSQQSVLPTIRGTIRDSATSSPLANAIIYIANTPFGTSSGDDGAFILKNVPSGEYTIIVSRVNYQSRTIPVTVDTSGSVDLAVDLVLKLIVTPEVEIVREGETPVPNKLHYFPLESPGTLCVYGTASTAPIAVIHTDSLLFLLSLDLDTVDGEKYVRLWMLFMNLGEAPYDFFPARDIRLSVQNGSHSYTDIRPEQNDWLRETLDTNTLERSMLASIEASLKSMAVQRTEYLYNETVFMKLLALDGLLYANLTRTKGMPTTFSPARDETLSGRLYNTYMTSVDIGLIGHHFVYPNNALRGYLYFPHPGLGWGRNGGGKVETEVNRYGITIATPTGVQQVVFIPS